MPVPRLSTLPGDAAQELAAILRGLLAHERELVADFLVHLAEFDRRGFALALAYGSLFDYCTRGLGLSRSSAFRRIIAARLLRRFPLVEPMLRDGRLSLMTLTLLKDVLDHGNHREVLARAAGLSKEQVAVLVAVLRPKAAPQDSVRPLPPARLVALPAAALPSAAEGQPAPPPSPGPSAAQEGSVPPVAATSPAPQVLVAVQPIPPPRVEPVSADLRVLKVTVSREFLAELDEVKAALSHVVPSGRFEEVVRECFRPVLARHRRRSRPDAAEPRAERASRPAETSPARPTGDLARPAIPAALERQVRHRDRNCCAFVGPDGRVCGSTYQLELHHLVPVALGGATTLENLLLVCRRHNDWLARQEFGEAYMARCRRRRLARTPGTRFSRRAGSSRGPSVTPTGGTDATCRSPTVTPTGSTDATCRSPTVTPTGGTDATCRSPAVTPTGGTDAIPPSGTRATRPAATGGGEGDTIGGPPRSTGPPRCTGPPRR